MKQSFIIIAALIGVIVLSFRCTDLKKDLPAFTSGNGSIHDEGWSTVSSAGFHGKVLKANDYNAAKCVSCHGKTFSGGSSGVSCFICHDAYPHSVKFEDGENHVQYMQGNNYPLAQCTLCHGANYSGGSIVEISCSDEECHATAGGAAKSPEACNTCHGAFRAAANDTITWAPPRALNGDTDSTSVYVGAHQTHLTDTLMSKVVACTQCHRVPSSLRTSGHINGTVDIVFDTTLAAKYTANHTFNPNPSIDKNTGKCNNTFCHGNWKLRKTTSYAYAFSDTVMMGAAFAPTFTGGSSQAACGSCHGLPPIGHNRFSGCGCHGDVTNSAGNAIVNKSKHINGKINMGVTPGFDF